MSTSKSAPSQVPGDPERGSSGDARIAVVIGSTRPSRICPGIAGSVQRALQAESTLQYELLDLADVDLPMLDEPLRASLNEYQHEHTRSWSATVASYDGFVFVLPQYNWGYPGVFKNALDYLYVEWHDKPATSVTYGSRGGKRAADQVRQVLQGLHMRSLEDRLEIVISRDAIDDRWQLTDVQAIMAPYQGQIRRIDTQMIEALKDSAKPLVRAR